MVRIALVTFLLGVASPASAQLDLGDGPATFRLYAGVFAGVGGAMLGAGWLGGPFAISDACGFEPECADAMSVAFVPFAGSWIAMDVGTQASRETAAMMGAMQIGGAALLALGIVLFWSADQMDGEDPVTIVPAYVEGGGVMLASGSLR
jgi:hypothetical protein